VKQKLKIIMALASFFLSVSEAHVVGSSILTWIAGSNKFY
jgi:hypothetical protein